MSGADGSGANTAAHTADTPQLLLEHHLKELRLPTMLREYDKVARQCAVEQVSHISIFIQRMGDPGLDSETRESSNASASTYYS